MPDSKCYAFWVGQALVDLVGIFRGPGVLRATSVLVSERAGDAIIAKNICQDCRRGGRRRRVRQLSRASGPAPPKPPLSSQAASRACGLVLGEQEAPGMESFMKAAVQAYEKKNPNITVQAVLQHSDTLYSAFRTAAKAGVGPTYSISGAVRRRSRTSGWVTLRRSTSYR